MKIAGLTFIALSAFAAMAVSCSNEWTGMQPDESGPDIEITVASNPYAAQTRITSGGIGISYGLIGFEENTATANYDNLIISENNISLNTSEWKQKRTNFTVYAPYSDDIGYLEDNGTFMIPFDMAESGQTPEMSSSFIVEKKPGTQSILTRTDKLSSTITLEIKGSSIINKVTACWISTKGFYVYDSNTGNGHWENQKGHRDIIFSAGKENNMEISFEAIPEELTAKHTINLYTDDKVTGISLGTLIGEKTLQPGRNYTAEIILDKDDFRQEIEFSSSISEWEIHNTSATD